MSILDAIWHTHRDQQLIFTTPELPWRASCDSIFKINTRTNKLEEQKKYTIELAVGVSKEILPITALSGPELALATEYNSNKATFTFNPSLCL